MKRDEKAKNMADNQHRTRLSGQPVHSKTEPSLGKLIGGEYADIEKVPWTVFLSVTMKIHLFEQPNSLTTRQGRHNDQN